MLFSLNKYQYFFPFKSTNFQGPDSKRALKDLLKYILNCKYAYERQGRAGVQACAQVVLLDSGGKWTLHPHTRSANARTSSCFQLNPHYLTKLQNRFMHRSSNWLTTHSKTIHIQYIYLVFQYSIWQEIHAPKTARLDWKSRKKGLYSQEQQHTKYVIYSIGVLRPGQLFSAVRLKTSSVYKISCCIKQKWKITIPCKCEKGNNIHLRYSPRKKVLPWAQRWARSTDVCERALQRQRDGGLMTGKPACRI